MAAVFDPYIFQTNVFQSDVTTVSTHNVGQLGFWHPIPLPFMSGTPAVTSGTTGEGGGTPGGFVDLRKEGLPIKDWIKKRRRKYWWSLLIDLQEMLLLAKAELEVAQDAATRAAEAFKQHDSQVGFIHSLETADAVEGLEEVIADLEVAVAEEKRRVAKEAAKASEMLRIAGRRGELERYAAGSRQRENTSALAQLDRVHETHRYLYYGDKKRKEALAKILADKEALDAADDEIALLLLQD